MRAARLVAVGPQEPMPPHHRITRQAAQRRPKPARPPQAPGAVPRVRYGAAPAARGHRTAGARHHRTAQQPSRIFFSAAFSAESAVMPYSCFTHTHIRAYSQWYDVFGGSHFAGSLSPFSWLRLSVTAIS